MSTEIRDRLVEAAIAIRERAYAPYSKFQVGSAILDETGAIHAAANVENAAYPVGQCAEANAIGKMIAEGGRKIVEIAVCGGGTELCTPCGGCRQRIREFAAPDVQIHICGPEGFRQTMTLEKLLPFSFGPDNLF